MYEHPGVGVGKRRRTSWDAPNLQDPAVQAYMQEVALSGGDAEPIWRSLFRGQLLGKRKAGTEGVDDYLQMRGLYFGGGEDRVSTRADAQRQALVAEGWGKMQP
jgi:hypothetical protein